MFKVNSSSNEYWWDEDTDVPGTMLQRLYDDLATYGVIPTHLSWSQGEQYHLDLFDGVHPTDSGYNKVFTEEAHFISNHLNNVPSVYPEMESASRSGNTIQVTIAGVLDLQPQSNIDGFAYIDSNDTLINVTAATANGNVVTLTLASTPIDANGTLYYVYDKAETFVLANGMVDASAANTPLRSGKIVNL